MRKQGRGKRDQGTGKRRGSALLIVLGMLSFMVVSAVAFSAYMRSSRLPSSYLLRMSSSRNLVKAGLAEALEEIDRAIGNNPHPGVGVSSSVNNFGQPVSNRNQWRERVFLGTNLLVGVDQTVSTMTLEGLAYVPAPLLNDVRYYSRRSPAAVWHELGFDAGRFAFTAIDVSDYFDINRAMAAPEGGGRTSADNARVSLAYLFEDTSHTGWRTQPTAWDTFMDNFLDDSGGSKVPLVSWADLNLAIWDKKPTGVLSPWCRFIENGLEFVQDDPIERQTLSNMVFVTDSLYPVPKTQTGWMNLDDGSKQPFYGLPIRNETSYRNRGVDEIAQNNNAFMKKFADNLSLPELVQLCDYLDVDRVPTSLAMPTTERVPMLLGVSFLGGNSEIRFELSNQKREIQKPGSQDTPGRKFVVTKYTLKMVGELRPLLAAVYPFKHGRGAEDSDSFRLQGAATITLVPSGSEKALRRKSAVAPAVCPWDSGSMAPAGVAYNGAGDFKSVVVMRSAMKPLTLKQNPTTEKDCVIAPLDLEFGAVNFELASKMEKSQYDDSDQNDVCTLRVVQEVDPESGTAIGSPEVTKGFLPSNADLSGAFATEPGNVADSQAFVPVIQFWARIVNGNGDTVDLMPACADDDKRPSELLKGDNVKSAFERPLLRFYDKADYAVNFSRAWFESGKNGLMSLAPQAYVADDPRFNHAPEDLAAVDNLAGELDQYWLDNNTAKNKDGDIFMSTSDAGYMQSKFEISYLLHVTGLFGNDMWGVLDNGGYDGSLHAGFGNAPAKDVMWRTYSQYAVNGNAGDRIDDLEMYSGSRGMRVCPYTPDMAVMMGALANTPRDWWAASTNDVGNVKQTMLSDINTSLKYTFSEHSDSAASKIRWGDMEALAKTFISSFRASTTVDGWQNIYDKFDWDGSLFDDIESGSSVTLDSVDRKFLYGFWRDCFATRQQLFLVFVRSEPMMLGGGGAGQLPPMLGARAVALVWRSPTTTNNNAPHQMRVLFYRQFD